MENDDGSRLYPVTSITSSRVEENYPKSLFHRSLFSRPLPSGKQVYFILFQFILLNIVGGITVVFFQIVVLEYNDYTGLSSIPTVVSFRNFSLLLCLPMGFIADRYFGRAKVLYYSWIFLFIAQLMITFYSVIHSYFSNNNAVHVIGIIICIIGLLVSCICLAGIRVNLIPFGVDQIERASSEQLSSYFHWYYWCRNVGQGLTFSVGASLVLSHDIFSLLVASAAAAVGTVIIVLGYDGFIKKQKAGNPLKLIYHVLKNAATVKRPTNRTAFSYDGRPEPSRIDLAKQTHLGKFPDEQVEDVKTFLRIMVFLISLIGFLIVDTTQENAYIEQSAFFDHPAVYADHNLTVMCVQCNDNNTFTKFHIHNFSPLFSLYWILIINNVTILVFIPILDRIGYPLCCPWVPSMFSRIGVGMIFSFISISCAIVVEAIRFHTFQHNSNSDQLDINVFHYSKVFSVNIPVGIMAPQLFAFAVAECLTLITMVEFIYAQSPSYMKGLLLGCLFFIEGLALTLGSLLFVSQSKGDTVWWEYYRTIDSDDLCKASRETGSSLAAYTLIAITTFLGIALFCYSAKKYKTRVRGEAQPYYLIT